MTRILEINNVNHNFETRGNSTEVLKDINLWLEQGEFVAIIGKSGSGKSTLLNIIAGFTKQTSGQVKINNIDINKLKENKRATFRQDNIGFVFQAYNLIHGMTAIENVQLPLEISGKDKSERYNKALEILKSMNLEGKKDKYPKELSGGEQQRIGICRAIITKPKLILADEPTGNLDSTNGEKIINILLDINKKHKTTLILVTHDIEIAQKADRVIHIKDGRIEPYENC